MKTLKNLLPALVFILCFNFTSAQETTAQKLENLKWYTVVLLKYEDGKMEAAQKIINDYFKPSDADMGGGGPVLELDLLFSDWDQLVVFPMEDGIQTLEWKVTPRDIEWRKAFAKRVGSEEKAQQIYKEFESYIKDYKSLLARTVGAN